jgi:Predicted transcriptional regulator
MEVQPRQIQNYLIKLIGKITGDGLMQPLTRNYQDYLIESLKDPSEAALYLWAILQEKDPEPELLLSALQDVAMALGQEKMSPEQLQEHLSDLKTVLDQPGSQGIYSLSSWLQSLGLTLSVIVNSEPNYRENGFKTSSF